MKPLVCEICKNYYNSWKRLEEHQQLEHGVGLKENHYCELGRRFCPKEDCNCVNNAIYRKKFKEARRRIKHEKIVSENKKRRESQKEARDKERAANQSANDRC